MFSKKSISIVASLALVPLLSVANECPPPGPGQAVDWCIEKEELEDTNVVEESSKIENLIEETLEDGGKKTEYDVLNNDGSKTQTTLEENGDGSLGLNISVLKADGTESKTSVSMPSDVKPKVEKKSDGSVVVSAELPPKDGVILTAQIETNLDGSTRVVIRDESGNIRASSVSYDGVDEVSIELLAEEALNNIFFKSADADYLAVMNRFKSSRVFTIAERRWSGVNLRDANAIPNPPSSDFVLSITPEGDSIFEEVNLFDGSQYIKLTSGKATMKNGDETIDMVLDKTYRVVVKTPISLKSGWNAVTSPINSTINSDVYSEYASESSSGNGKPIIWVMNSEGNNYLPSMGTGNSIDPGTGVWVKAKANATFMIDDNYPSSKFVFSNKYKNTTTYGDIWRFIGVSNDTTVKDILATGIDTFWPYNGHYGVYDIGYNSGSAVGNIDENSVIKAGTAFWAK